MKRRIILLIIIITLILSISGVIFLLSKRHQSPKCSPKCSENQECSNQCNNTYNCVDICEKGKQWSCQDSKCNNSVIKSGDKVVVFLDNTNITPSGKPALLTQDRFPRLFGGTSQDVSKARIEGVEHFIKGYSSGKVVDDGTDLDFTQQTILLYPAADTTKIISMNSNDMLVHKIINDTTQSDIENSNIFKNYENQSNDNRLTYFTKYDDIFMITKTDWNTYETSDDKTHNTPVVYRVNSNNKDSDDNYNLSVLFKKF